MTTFPSEEYEKVVVKTGTSSEEDLRYVAYVRDDTLVVMGPSMPRKIVFHDMSVEPTFDIALVSGEAKEG